VTALEHIRLLVLWDIDRTLVDVSAMSREIYATAFAAVTGRPLEHFADMAGRTERAILVDTLALHGVDHAEEQFDVFYQALAKAAADLGDRMRTEGRQLDGARQAMSAFARRGVLQSVVTGNIKPIAITKLEAFDLTTHLDLEVGGYGSDDAERATLVRLARQRTQRKYGISPSAVVVVGDTVRDIVGAHSAGAAAVGVATGRTSLGELAAAGAEQVLPDLADTAAVIDAVARAAELVTS
jgi:phosphoglycolate phosphatase-like HAD superfamily hydrolase